MNIFVLSEDVKEAAEWHVDRLYYVKGKSHLAS